MGGKRNEQKSKQTVHPLVHSWRSRMRIYGCRGLAAGMYSASGNGHWSFQQSLLSVRLLWTVETCAYRWAGSNRGFLYYFVVKALNADIDEKYRKTKSVQFLCGIFTVAIALTIHTWVATMAWFATYLGLRIGAEAALAAVTAYQDAMLPAILPLYLPMLLVFAIHFVMLLAGKTRYPKWMLAFHPVTWNLLLAAVPDIAQAMQVPVATWMSVMSQSSTNSAIMVWCIAAAVYERKHTQ